MLRYVFVVNVLIYIVCVPCVLKALELRFCCV
jgi:hypothetical protein